MFEFDNVGQVLFHVVVLFGVALIVVRLMGNRTVGQLSPFDFVIMVGTGDIIVSASMDPSQSILRGIEGLLALLMLQQIIGYLSLKSPLLRKWFEGTPVTLIENGEIIKENFKKTHFNFDDLRQELHRHGMDMTDIQHIQSARLESCGVFSVIKKPDKEPLTPSDLDRYFTMMHQNPLNPIGKQWLKIEQLATDVASLVEVLKNDRRKEQIVISQKQLYNERH